MDSNFACQACSFETTIAERAEEHEIENERHEVFEYFAAPIMGL